MLTNYNKFIISIVMNKIILKKEKVNKLLEQLIHLLFLGRDWIGIDRWYPSSKRCSNCGHVEAKMPLFKRQWTCPECNTNHDRDINAARNILAAGLAVTVCGENVSPVSLLDIGNSLRSRKFPIAIPGIPFVYGGEDVKVG